MPYTAKTAKLHRVRKQRRALLKILASNLILRKKIKTTEAKAKSVRPFVERLVTVAKKNTLASNRYIARYLPKEAMKALGPIAVGYKERPGGYLRIIKVGPRMNDSAPMAYPEIP